MPITNNEAWKKWIDDNSDPYGKACIDVAREVMRVLDEGKDFDPHQIICDADDKIQAGGLTGFMAGCVARIVKECHSRGEEFNDKWNELYGVSKEKAAGGTVNPAVMTISEKE